MSCSIPQEILDLIIDHLYDEPTTLKTCCVVSKTWIQRTRKHLFVNMRFPPSGRHVGRWRRTFPDPTNSPARHARTLYICQPRLITSADVDTLLTFCGVVCLSVDIDFRRDQRASLVPLRGFSPVLRSLRLTFASLLDSEIFGLVHSFPILEDLALVSFIGRKLGMGTPSASPRLSGTLELRLIGGIRSVVDKIFDLSNGFHFRKIAIPWFSEGDVFSTMDLVSRYSGTLESLEITNCFSRTVSFGPCAR